MAAPSVAYVPIDIGDLLPHGDCSAALIKTMRDNQEHLKEVAYGTGSGYTGGTAHDHDGTDSAAVDQCVHENLLIGSCIGRYRRGDAWTLSGFRVLLDIRASNGLVYGGETSGHHLFQQVGGSASDESRAMVGLLSGDGMDCVASFFLRPVKETLAAGALSFGFADNSTSVFTAAATLAYTDLRDGWQRVYARFHQAGALHATNVRFLVRVTTGFTSGLALTGFQLNRGRVLAPWTISNVEGQYASHGNVNYVDMPNAPIIDQEIAMDLALDLTP